MRDSDAVRPGPDPYLPTHGDDRYTVDEMVRTGWEARKAAARD